MKLPLKSAIQTCRTCGCTDEFGCPDSCYWIEPDLCSGCANAIEHDNLRRHLYQMSEQWDLVRKDLADGSPCANMPHILALSMRIIDLRVRAVMLTQPEGNVPDAQHLIDDSCNRRLILAQLHRLQVATIRVERRLDQTVTMQDIHAIALAEICAKVDSIDNRIAGTLSLAPSGSPTLAGENTRGGPAPQGAALSTQGLALSIQPEGRTPNTERPRPQDLHPRPSMDDSSRTDAALTTGRRMPVPPLKVLAPGESSEERAKEGVVPAAAEGAQL